MFDRAERHSVQRLSCCVSLETKTGVEIKSVATAIQQENKFKGSQCHEIHPTEQSWVVLCNTVFTVILLDLEQIIKELSV